MRGRRHSKICKNLTTFLIMKLLEGSLTCLYKCDCALYVSVLWQKSLLGKIGLNVAYSKPIEWSTKKCMIIILSSQDFLCVWLCVCTIWDCMSDCVRVTLGFNFKFQLMTTLILQSFSPCNMAIDVLYSCLSNREDRANNDML